MRKKEESERDKGELMHRLEEEPLHERKRSQESLQEGWRHQWARMDENEVISIRDSSWLPGGIRGCGASETAPGCCDYEQIRSLHKLEKPGDSSRIVEKLIDGKWVVEEGTDDY